MSIWFLLLILSIVLFFFLAFQKKIRKGKKALLLVLSLGLVLFMGFRWIIPLNPALKPTGDLEVNTDVFFYRYRPTDPQMLTSAEDREVPVKVWYPLNKLAKSCPLLIFSHGSFGVYDSNETLFLELASRGYVVMSLNHPYHSFTATLSDGSSLSVDSNFLQSTMGAQGSEDLEGTLKSLRDWVSIRIEDMNMVLDEVLEAPEENPYEALVDPNRIVLSGHSLGGSAALALGRQRPQDMRALAILESPFITDIQGVEGDRYVFTEEDYPLPVLHIYSDALFGKLDQITTYEMNARMMKSGNPIYVSKHISGTGHIGLTDMVLVSPILTNMIDRGLNARPPKEVLLELNGHVLDFLEIYNP